MRPRSYRELVTSLGLEYCRGILRGSYCHRDHRVGSAEPGVVHYDDHRVTWPGLVRVLKLCVMAGDQTLQQEPPWRRVYLINQQVNGLAARSHLRIPARYREFDRAFVRAGVANISNDTPLRREAFDWARR